MVVVVVVVVVGGVQVAVGGYLELIMYRIVSGGVDRVGGVEEDVQEVVRGYKELTQDVVIGNMFNKVGSGVAMADSVVGGVEMTDLVG